MSSLGIAGFYSSDLLGSCRENPVRGIPLRLPLIDLAAVALYRYDRADIHHLR